MAKLTEVRCGIIGYGGSFNMGQHHINSIQLNPGMRAVAVCDLDPARTQQAKADFPQVETYNDVAEMLQKAPVDLVVIITPHNTHAPLAIQALEAGKHVVVEKPMCLNIEEADAMIAAAKRSGKMLSVFHNRRWDGDFLAMRDVIDRGVIGEVFHLEAYSGGYHAPGNWWRSDKKISGGAFFDWGAHFLYWVLSFIPGPIDNVTGFFHKRVWKEVTNEDQVQALIRFRSGAVADVQLSSIAMVGKPRWRILGTKGAIVDEGRGSFKVRVLHDGFHAEFDVKYQEGQWHAYYKNVADHLLRGEPLEITAEAARRVIAVMDLAERSAKSGQAEKMPEL